MCRPIFSKQLRLRKLDGNTSCGRRVRTPRRRQACHGRSESCRLWDNSFFGHSLTEAAALIGKDPEEVKRDPFQNIRAGAALMRKLYDETPRSDGSTEAQIESWRFAIRKYCGIPEPELNARHALDVYTFMSKGYHQYGVDWEGRPVNLELIRAETKQIVAEEQLKKQLSAGSATNFSASTGAAPSRLQSRQPQRLRHRQISVAHSLHPNLSLRRQRSGGGWLASS